jgi:hypothetical protein
MLTKYYESFLFAFTERFDQQQKICILAQFPNTAKTLSCTIKN